MTNFFALVGALLTASLIWVVVTVALFNSKRVRKWYMNYCVKLSEEMVELMDED